MGAFSPKSPSSKQREQSAKGYRLRDTDDRIHRGRSEQSGVSVVVPPPPTSQLDAAVTSPRRRRPLGGSLPTAMTTSIATASPRKTLSSVTSRFGGSAIRSPMPVTAKIGEFINLSVILLFTVIFYIMQLVEIVI